MYKAVYNVQYSNFNIAERKIFTPFINCYIIHSVILYINGIAYQEDVNFTFENNYTHYKFDFIIEDDDNVIFDINYFYIRENYMLFDSMIGESFSDRIKSCMIVSKHYIDGQFSLDNGLYKNAAMNFGTVLEGILNESLGKRRLVDLINNYRETASKKGLANKSDMHFIRELRNKVHPEQISNSQDISRSDAVEARNKLETILNDL